MTMTAKEAPTIPLSSIPKYFGGEWKPYRYERACEALAALTNRPKDDAALHLALFELDEGLLEFIEAVQDFCRVLYARTDLIAKHGHDNFDEWSDEEKAALTGAVTPRE